MKVTDKIDKYLKEQFEFAVANPTFKIVSDEKVFEAMANFLVSLEPEQLNDEQLHKIADIFTEMKSEAEVEDMGEEVKARKSQINTKQYATKYYRLNKDKIKLKKDKLERSIKGQSRDRMKSIQAKIRKTPTGRHKVSYNV